VGTLPYIRDELPSDNQSLQGLDWHGPSADDAWGTVSALDVILKTCSRQKDWAIAPEKVVIIGHSNGGQGTWYNAARHPDRVVASKKLPISFLFLGSDLSSVSQSFLPLGTSKHRLTFP
jgi:triacylglycerol esterase/lipase EstA (alpha/beta hydrolase family)